MYVPPQFDQKDRAHTLALMRAHNFATLVTTDADGQPFATHLPLIVTERTDTQESLVLEGHVAKPNPHWKLWANNPTALVIFMGPNAYMSPRVYPDLVRVPTWNYLAVHASGTVKLLEGEAKKDALLKGLIALHEPEYAAQWRGLGEEYQHKMLAGIVAFEITVTKLESKFKLNQHRKESHEKMHALYAQGTPDEQALTAWMKKLGM